MNQTTKTIQQLYGPFGRQWLRTDQLAAEFQFPSRESVRKFIMRHEVPRKYRGRVLLVDRRDFERACEKKFRKAS